MLSAVPTKVHVPPPPAVPPVFVIVIVPLANALSTDQLMSEEVVVTSLIDEEDVGVVTVNIGGSAGFNTTTLREPACVAVQSIVYC